MSLLDYFRKRKLTRVNCRTCGFETQVATPPGVHKLDFQCGECVRQQRVPEYVPNDEHSMYFVTESANGTIKQKLGSDTDPFSLAMYQRLDTVHTATSEEIRDAYNRRRLLLNPPNDLNQRRENAAETARVDEAYKILSEPTARRNYNKFGLTPDCVIIGEGGFDQLSNALGHMLGDGNFYDIIGSSVLTARLVAEEERAKLGMYNNDNPRPPYQDADDAFLRDVSLVHVANVLNQKLRRYNPENEGEFRNFISEEAEQLRRHRNGLKILRAVGYMYSILGDLYEMTGANDLTFFIVDAKMHWQYMLFHMFQFFFYRVKTDADYNYAIDEERDYLAKQWRTVSRRQQLRERCLRQLHDKYWVFCKYELEWRIYVACQIVMGGRELARNRDDIRQMIERKANALKIIGEIYKNLI